MTEKTIPSFDEPTRKRQKVWPRRLLIGAVVLVMVAALAWALSPRPLPVDLAQVTVGSLRVTLDEEGETRARERFVMSAPVAGRLLRIELEPGDAVRANDVVATFEPSAPALLDERSEATAKARLKSAQAALGRSRADRQRVVSELAFAKTDLERQQRLVADQVVSSERLERAELEVERGAEALHSADFALRSAEQDVVAARAALLQSTGGGEPMVLRSPIDGVVLRRARESESVVVAGETLLEIADPAQLEVVSDFLSTDAVKIRPGQPVEIVQWGGDGALAGTVRRVEPSGFTKVSALGVEEQRVNVIIDVDASRDAWQALGDGFRVEVQVVIWQEDDALQVPMSALFRDSSREDRSDGGGSWTTFVVENGVATRQRVEIAQRNGLAAKVVSGVSEGQRVVLHPSDELADGMEVEELDV